MGARALQFGVVALVLGVLGLPVSDLFRYGLLAGAAIAVATGTVVHAPRRWLAATAAAVVAAAVLTLWPAPRIDEGYNFYFANPGIAADLRLPPDVASVLEAQFDSEYSPQDRCDPGDRTCCRIGSFPAPRGFAFSADAIYEHPAMSRRVTGIDFSDPVQLRLGDINKLEYNPNRRYCPIEQFHRDRRSMNLLDRFPSSTRFSWPIASRPRSPAAVCAGAGPCCGRSRRRASTPLPMRNGTVGRWSLRTSGGRFMPSRSIAMSGWACAWRPMTL